MKEIFSQKEKAALIKVLNIIISADGNIHKSEELLMKRISNKYNFSKEDAILSWSYTHEDCCEIFKLMNEKKKSALAQIITKMAIADKYYTPEEAHIILTTIEKSQIELKL